MKKISMVKTTSSIGVKSILELEQRENDPYAFFRSSLRQGLKLLFSHVLGNQCSAVALLGVILGLSLRVCTIDRLRR